MEYQPLYQQNQMSENQFHLKKDENAGSPNVFLIIFQLLVWFMLIYTFLNPDFFPLLVFVYIIYIILALFSPTGLFLLNKKSANSLYYTLKENFNSPPVLQLIISCYHIEKSIKTIKTREGKLIDEEIEEKKETYKERRDFPYYSFRDISGLFRIDLDNPIFRNKVYIKLTLDTMISYADSISYYDYQNYKNAFIDENKTKDDEYYFRENFYISNLSKNNLIRIKDEEPYYINYCFFFLCTLLTMALPYEIKLSNISIEGKYQIKKLISTRYNLFTPENNITYENSIPSIKLGNLTYNFNNDDYGYYNPNADIKSPNLEELEKAKQYNEEIKKPIFDDHLFDENANANAGYPDLDLPTQEEVYNNSNKYD